MSRPRLLLVTPAFHGYWRSIADALDRRGYNVSCHRYDEVHGLSRMGNKLLRELPERVTGTARPETAMTLRAIRAIDTARPDILVVIKGDRLEGEFWTRAAGVPRRVLWLYDELRRTKHSSTSLTAAGPIASYSDADVVSLQAQGYQAVYLPLAHDPFIPFDPRVGTSVTFVGARYPNREKLLVRLQAAGVPVMAYGRDWSSHPADRLRTWRLRATPVPGGRDLSRSAAYGVMAGAPATLNIHGDQDGFTMRTFEAAGVGAVQAIDRQDVSRYYVPNEEICTFSSPEECVDVTRRAFVDRRWAADLREAAKRRTLHEHTFDHRVANLEQLWA